ncbi:MAG: CbiX/SirB N-terminal domain-containing protein [Prosthecobacter sp.]|uniref:CbiX/SirB N-terminal domain-containing protein n=1 Tax=Prosthecobacter sp. TaxID=1965333 RepID=UPI003902D6E0
MSSLQHTALIIVGHGSTVNPDSSAPTHLHADAIRRRGIFREVVCCFWKEEPNMREVYEMVDSDIIYIVPNFISEGYFCQQVLPRELRLDGPITQRDGKTIYYCDPVGIHPNMTRLLLQRADEVAPGVPRDRTSLVIVGHGTNLNENSRKVIETQVALIRDGGHGFAEVVDTYMEEAPFIADWAKLTTAPDVVVVPFFIADGLHSFQDIPVLLGMREEIGAALSESGVFHHNPHQLQGRLLYYSGAIGTAAHMADVILDQVHDFDAKHGGKAQTGKQKAEIIQALAAWLQGGRDQIGEIAIIVNPDGTFSLCHIADRGKDDLQVHHEAHDALFIARNDASGVFRPLHSAPTLNRGWRLDLATLDDLRLALDFLYPAALGMAHALEQNKLAAVPLRDVLGRQTGMYRFANTITDDQAHALIGKCCANENCLRRILWPLTATQQMANEAASKTQPNHAPNAIPLLCIEACTHIVSAARKIARESHEANQPKSAD